MESIKKNREMKMSFVFDHFASFRISSILRQSRFESDKLKNGRRIDSCRRGSDCNSLQLAPFRERIRCDCYKVFYVITNKIMKSCIHTRES